ncbi:hypothetical protein CHELA40_15098 [Chelatococcus asaccharovorans]|nr:hypothetical protein CHELA17_60523 [Chelatococcus asaccharovorans]CAH1681496.1 hypothetical protein CHELA40_15098 [Chelatococcus asaccharovorans]
MTHCLIFGAIGRYMRQMNTFACGVPPVAVAPWCILLPNALAKRSWQNALGKPAKALGKPQVNGY